MAPTLLDPNLPPELDAVIARAMAKNPSDRYQRAMELALDLGELLEGRQPASQVAGSFARREAPHSLDSGHLFTTTLLARARSLTAKRAIAVAVCIASAVALYAWRRPSIDPAPVVGTPVVGAVASAPIAPIAPSSPSKATPRVGLVPVHAKTPKSTLDLEIDHHFKDGKISVWVDGKLEYTHPLQTEGKKHFLNLRKAHAQVSQTLSLSAGSHQVGVRVQSPADSFDQEKEVSSSFAPGAQKILRISFDGPHGALQLGLK
jgi:hypothetical protein